MSLAFSDPYRPTLRTLSLCGQIISILRNNTLSSVTGLYLTLYCSQIISILRTNTLPRLGFEPVPSELPETLTPLQQEEVMKKKKKIPGSAILRESIAAIKGQGQVGV
uniref:Uncharacterized protein n=1 Tax=Cacopsylla melanoneura TaxID=428564 RepID=A0A8D8TI23_9HEMI